MILHQFRVDTVPERERLDTSRDELALMVHADGQGSQPLPGRLHAPAQLLDRDLGGVVAVRPRGRRGHGQSKAGTTVASLSSGS